MKKLVFSIIGVAAIAAVVIFNVSIVSRCDHLSDIAPTSTIFHPLETATY
jgi:hypothetical protein